MKRKALPEHLALTLEDIGRSYGTDKSSKKHDYLRRYEAIVAPLLPRAETVMEIGVLNGASVKMWRDFFPTAQIVGIDIKEARKQYEGERIHIEIGSQADPAFLKTLADRYRPDLVIEDGSHIWSHQILTFETLYATVKPGGIYIVEDMHTSAVGRYGDSGMKVASEYFGTLAAHA